MRRADASRARVERDGHGDAHAEAEDYEAGKGRLRERRIDVHERQDSRARGGKAEPEWERGLRSQARQNQLAGDRRGDDDAGDHREHGHARLHRRVSEVFLQVVRHEDGRAHLGRAEGELCAVRGAARRIRDDPQGQHRLAGHPFPDDEKDKQGAADADERDGRGRTPRCALGAVEAEDDAEKPRAPQYEAEKVVRDRSPGIVLVSRRERLAAGDESEGGDENVDEHRPSPVEEVGQRPSQEEAHRGADPSGGAYEREGAGALLGIDEGVVDEGQNGGGEQGAEDALGGACACQHGEGRRQAADEAGYRESHEADRVGPSDPDDPDEAPAEEHEAAEGQRVRCDDPRALGVGHLEAALHARQRHGDDRHVEHDHQLGCDDAREDRGFVLGLPAACGGGFLSDGRHVNAFKSKRSFYSCELTPHARR